MRQSVLAQEGYCIQCLPDYMMIYLLERKTFSCTRACKSARSEKRKKKNSTHDYDPRSREFHARSIPPSIPHFLESWTTIRRPSLTLISCLSFRAERKT